MKSAPLLALVALLGAATADAADREIEWSATAGFGSAFSLRPPFTFEDLDFAGPYKRCPDEELAGVCILRTRQSDVAYGLDVKYPVVFGGGIDLRQPLGGALWLDLGASGTLALRQRRLLRAELGVVDRSRPFEPEDLSDALANHLLFSQDGMSGLVYLHGGLRYAHDLRGANRPGDRALVRDVFVEAGGGWLPVVPGGALSTLGHPLAVHGTAGVTLRRGFRGGGLALSARYLRALVALDEALLVSSRPSWITFQVGFIPGR